MADSDAIKRLLECLQTGWAPQADEIESAVAEEATDASNYPNRAIHYIVPYPPGAFNDTLARIVSQKLQEAWGVSVVVDDRPGAAP